MGNKQLTTEHEEVVPTYTLAAAFAIAFAMGLVVVTGIVFKPYEAKQVVEQLHERIMYEKEMRELRRLSYHGGLPAAGPQVVSEAADAHYFPESSYAVTPVMPTPERKRTERAENFETEVRTEDFWASLESSIRNDVVTPSSSPVVIPPIVVGSAE